MYAEHIEVGFLNCKLLKLKYAFESSKLQQLVLFMCKICFKLDLNVSCINFYSLRKNKLLTTVTIILHYFNTSEIHYEFTYTLLLNT